MIDFIIYGVFLFLALFVGGFVIQIGIVVIGFIFMAIGWLWNAIFGERTQI